MAKKYEYGDVSVDRFSSGFVAIIGAPNVGKSTLLNLLLGYKISITSKKPQTTRNRILGILTRPSAQFVFIDTPGVHETSTLFNSRIVDVAFTAILDVDLVLFVVDVSNRDPKVDQILLNKLKRSNKKVVLAMNKIDKIEKYQVLEMIDSWSNLCEFTGIVPVCALTGDQLETLISVMQEALPYGMPMFPADSLTDVSERFIVAEMIREKVFRLTGQEVPYSVAVTVDTFEEKIKKKLVHICATIHVERYTQKGIVIGQHGRKLKQIGEASRLDIQKLLETKVFLKLFIRVQKNWSKDTKALRKFGY